ncbi:MAG: hypothetical protein AB1Z98_06465 [Nannocystaceae bacterium]
MQGGCNGVEVFCHNHNAEAADDTGGGGGDGNEWHIYPSTLEDCNGRGGELIDVEGIGACKLTASLNVAQGAIAVCVGEGYPASLDVLDPLNWQNEGYPAIDDEIREQCTAQCNSNQFNTAAGPQEVCEDANWSAVRTLAGWDTTVGYNCQVTGEPVGLDPDGSDVPWQLVGGSFSPMPLDCSLDGSYGESCASWFYPHVGAWVLTPGSANFIEPETRFADYLGVEGSGSQLELDMFGSGSGVDDTEPLYGMAEYTGVDCGEDVCPFFLANLTAYNTADTWEVRVDTPAGRIPKLVTDVQIDLMQSTLGIRNMALDVVAFAPGALRLRAEFKVSSCSSCDSTSDGVHGFLLENEDYVFAHYDDGALTISHEFSMQSGGTAMLTVAVVPDEHPPTAIHDLGTTELADHVDGLVLDQARSQSVDPDDDIVFESWWVDGVAVGHGGVIPVGNHEVSLEARDARGAVHRTADQWVHVADPS